MSKQRNGGTERAANQIALTRRQRRRPRGEVYRQPPRVRTRTQIAVQALDAPRSSDKFAAVAPEDAAVIASGDGEDAIHASIPSGSGDSELASTGTAPRDGGDALPGDSLATSPRLPRRTRTLADVVQPARGAGERSQPSASLSRPIQLARSTGIFSDPALTHPTPVPAGDTSLADTQPLLAAIGANADEASEDPQPDVDGAEPTDQSTTVAALHLPAASIPVPRSARPSIVTHPMAAIAGVASLARARGRVGDPWGTSPAAVKDDDEIPARYVRAARQGIPALAAHVALGHAIAAVVLAVMASALVLVAHPLGVWLLFLAALAAAGGGLAYLLLWWRRSARLALTAVVLAQMGALAWALLLFGPHAALLVLAAPAVALALRAGGRRPALLAGCGMVAIYAGFQGASSFGIHAVFLLSLPQSAAVDVLAVALGFGLLLVELLVAAAARERDLAAARARLYEVRFLRGHIGALRAEIEEDGRALDEALTHALRGRGLEPLALDSPLRLVAERINIAAERLRTLQSDREDLLCLQGATRTLARALERGWLGLPWVWPDTSGTMLDDVIALLRTPRPTDSSIERRDSPMSGPLAPISLELSRPSLPSATSRSSCAEAGLEP